MALSRASYYHCRPSKAVPCTCLPPIHKQKRLGRLETALTSLTPFEGVKQGAFSPLEATLAHESVNKKLAVVRVLPVCGTHWEVFG